MSFVYYNPNPLQRMDAGDCTVRAISKVMGCDWEKAYAATCVQGLSMGEMPSANSVWGSYLLDNGFELHSLMRRCKECYTLSDFCLDHPYGTYVVGTDNHAVAVINGDHFDSFDSANVYPTYYFEKKEGEK